MKSRVSSPDSRQRELAAIHLRAKELGLDTADKNPASEYRSILWSIGRQHSAADLDQAGRLAVLDHLKARKRREVPAPAGAVDHGAKPAVQAELQPQINKIEALLSAGGKHWNYAHGIAERMFRVKRLEWCRADQLRGVITALEKQARRGKTKAAG